MATRIGLEPTTPSVTGWCSNQLSYRAMIAQVRAAFTAGTCLIIPEDGRLVKRKKQKSRKKDEKGGLLGKYAASALLGCRFQRGKGKTKPPKIVRHTQHCAIFHYYVNYITIWRQLQLTYREKKSFYFGRFPQAVGCNSPPALKKAQKNTPKS